MKRSNEIIEVDVEILHVKEKALLLTDGYLRTWLPTSQLPEIPDVGYTGPLKIPSWLAEKEGLI